MAIFKIVASRVNNIEADQYGNVNVEPGQIWYDPDTGVLRLYDGNVGGYIINQGGGGNPVRVDYNGNIVTANVSTINFTGNGVSVTGSGSNVTVDIIQSAGNYSNANVTALLADFGSNSITTTGNITAANFITTGSNVDAGNVNVTGNVTAEYFIGNGSLLANITGANVTGTVALATYATTANSVAVANVVGIGNIATLNLTGSSSTVLYGNGVFAPASGGGGTPGGANTYVQFNNNGSFDGVANLTFDKVTNTLSATNIAGNGSGLTSITGANVTGQVGYAAIANSVAGANVSGTVSSAEVANTANSVSGANVSGQVSNALVAGTVYTNAQPNITSVGELSSLSVIGNVSADYFIGNGSLLTGIVSTLPPQTDNSGKYLYTNGITPSWEFVPGVFGLVIDGGNASYSSSDFIIDGGGA